MNKIPHDLTRNVLAVLALGILIASSLWILRPFLPSLVWATMIVVATWPVMTAIQARAWGKRWIAVALMTLLLLLVLIIPLAFAIGAIIQNVDEIPRWAKSLSGFELPPAPDWLAGLPVVGERLAGAWNELAAGGHAALVAKVAPYLGVVTRWFASQIGGFGLILVEFLLTVLIAAILYLTGESVAEGVQRFARRLAGDRGHNVVRLAAQAVRGVALGVVVTALVQAVLGGLGLAVAGVPFAAIFTGVMFILAIAQIGVAPVLVIAIGWLYWRDEHVWATALLVWTVIVTGLDNILRPVLIKKGADLPLLLIFAGVIGGLIAFGIIGIFIGPVMLAVTYTLLEAWVEEAPAAPADTNALPPGSGGAP